MELLEDILPIILYSLGIVLLVILIILSIKLIKTVNHTNEILDDVEEKSKSLNGLFSTIDVVTDALSNVSDSLVDGVAGLITKIFRRKRRQKEKENEDDE